MKMKKYEDFVPKTDIGKLEWTINFLSCVREAAAKTNTTHYTEKGLTELEEEISIYIEALRDAERKKIASQAANSLKQVLERKTIRRMRTFALLMKRSNADESIIAKMRIKCKEEKIDPSIQKPVFKAKAVKDVVELHFKKNHIFNVSFYSRYPGEEWIHIGYGFDSPYLDKRPLAVPLQPERREYMARFANVITELGQPSDIVSVPFGG